MKRQVEVPIFILGIVIWVVAIFLPVDSLEFILGNGLRPLGLATIFICPILGIIGIVFSLIEKSVAKALLNFLLVLAFPIIMLAGHLFIK